MSEAMTITIASVAALAVVGVILKVSLRMTDRKELRSARVGTTGAPVLNNEWVALNSDAGGADCSGADSGGSCD